MAILINKSLNITKIVHKFMDKYLYRGEIDQQLKLSVTHRMWGPLASSAIH